METLQRIHNRGSISTGYDIDNSYKNENDNTERMYRSWGGITANTRTWTVSLWVKRTELGACYLWGAGVSGNDVVVVNFDSSDRLGFRSTKSAANDCVYLTNRVFRDTSAWYHLVFAVDTTSGTAGNRLRIYVNGVEETSFATETNFDQNDLTLHNANGSYMEVGSVIGESPRFNGYIAEVNSITGTQYAPTAFGKFDDDSGIWIPILFAGSYAENSVFLEFKDSSSLGTDTSGNGQTFTLQNLSAADQATDTPTNNFQIFLSDGTIFNTGADNMTFSEGGTKWSRGQTGWTTAYANIAMSKGKWYMEFENYATNGYAMYGIIPVARTTASERQNYYMGSTTDGTVAYHQGSGNINQNGGATSAATSVTGDIIGCAVDMDNNKAYWHKNGTYVNSSNPVTGSSGTTTAFGLNDEPYFFAVSTYNPGVSGKTNTGGYTAVSISSAASDANGYGTFEYAPPSGYYALCTKNLEEFG